MNSNIKELLITFKLIKFYLKKQTKINDLNKIKELKQNIYYSLSYKSQILIILYLMLIKYFELNYYKLDCYKSSLINNQLILIIKDI